MEGVKNKDYMALLGQYCWVRLAGLGLLNPIFAALGLFEGEETCKVGLLDRLAQSCLLGWVRLSGFTGREKDLLGWFE